MHTPWQIGEPLTAGAHAEVRRRAIFDCCKWDPQVGDVSTLAVSPLLLPSSVWEELSGLATKLAAETLAMEAELVRRPELHQHLALPRSFRKALAASTDSLRAVPALRLMRFDFHWTTEGWRISETNSDVPGGFVEASGISALVAEHSPGSSLAGDPSAAIAEAIQTITGPAANVALVHATAYTDDRQVMVHLAGRLARLGLRPHLVAPDHLNWLAGRPHLPSEWGGAPLDFVFRFFPAEWLPSLPRRCEWPHFLGTSHVPLCNPATALLTQSKRLPLVWDQLEARHPTWQSLLPETRDPSEVDWRNSEEWIVKPALGRVGDSVGINGVTSESEWRQIRRYVRWHGKHWVAQRRFDAVPAMLEGQPAYPCIGVYTLGTRACGIYGRIARRALIDHSAQDIAVLVTENAPCRNPRGTQLWRLFMDREQLFDIWAPAASPWSRWAKPVLFAEMNVILAPAEAEPVLRIDVQRDERTAIVVDLPGADSVKTGLALAADGYRPVPLFNGARGPSLNLSAVCLVSVEPIIAWLVRGAGELSRLTLPASAPPAFLLDANRQTPNASPSPGKFDNRWVVFPQDFPSANFLRSQGIRRILLLHNRGTNQPDSDLAHVMLRWQEAGMELFGFNPTAGSATQPIVVNKPSWFRALWQQAFAIAGLRRNSAGGFGSVIPQPSSGAG